MAIGLSVICLGISSLVVQIISLREFLNVFAGNELVIGLVLGNWLLLTGLGGLIGRRAGRPSIRWVILCQMVIALAPPAQIAAIRLFKATTLPGLMPGVTDTFLVSLLLLAPYCLVSGLLLTLFSGIASGRREARQIGDVYLLDTVGDIVGGALFSFILVYLLPPFRIVTLLLVLNLSAAAFLSFTSKKKALGFSSAILLLIALPSLFLLPLERITTEAMFRGQELVRQQTTPFGHLAVTRQGGQINVYENGLPVGSTANRIAAEETVHYALSQHPNPKGVLLLSGGLTGAIQEIAKYPVDRIDYAELDPAVIEITRTIGALDPRVRPIARDGRLVVRSNRSRYDVLLIGLPDPASAQQNRFYTVEFFQEVRRALRAGGVVSLGFSGAENYANPEARTLSASVYRSLHSVFKNILVIPGPRHFFIASEDTPLDYAIADHLEEKGIQTSYVNENYLSAKLTADRIAEAEKSLTLPASLNRDFAPATYYAHLRYWQSQLGQNPLLPVLLISGIVGLIAFALVRSPRRIVSTTLGTTGLAGIGLEVTLLIAFQVLHGYVYHQMGLLLTAFLAGGALGAGWSTRTRREPWPLLFRLDLLLSALSFLLVPVLLSLHQTGNSFLQTMAPPVVFPILTASVGFLVGAEFPLAAKLTFQGVEKTAGTLYAVDFLGSSLGALLVSAFAIPLLGITTTLCLVGGIKFFTSVALKILKPIPSEEISPLPETTPFFYFGMVLTVFAGIGLLIIAEPTGTAIYDLSFIPIYYWGLIALLGVGILQAMSVNFPKPMRWLHYAGFALVAFYPLFRCYFKVPYLFCHVCPRLCIFGFLRPYLIPAVLIMNLEKRHWCYHACPIGTLYDCQVRTGGKAWRLPAVFKYLPYAVLIFTVIAYFKVESDLANAPTVVHDWYTFFYNNLFAVSLPVIVISLLLILTAWRLRRSFCTLLCPVGTFSDLVNDIGRYFFSVTGRGAFLSGTRRLDSDAVKSPPSSARRSKAFKVCGPAEVPSKKAPLPVARLFAKEL